VATNLQRNSYTQLPAGTYLPSASVQLNTLELLWAQMSMSTIIMPCNTSGWFDASFAAQYGIVDIDWSNGRAQWSRSTPMDDDSRLATQAAMIKAINPNTHVWIYRNLVKALSWYDAVREKLEDPQYSGWFLHFNNPDPSNYSVPRGNTSLYHSQDQTPTVAECGGTKCDCGSIPCGEYLWDPRNASLRHWLINTHILGPSGLGNPNVSGFCGCFYLVSHSVAVARRRFLLPLTMSSLGCMLCCFKRMRGDQMFG
jgi:hypothetical protein